MYVFIDITLIASWYFLTFLTWDEDDEVAKWSQDLINGKGLRWACVEFKELKQQWAVSNKHFVSTSFTFPLVSHLSHHSRSLLCCNQEYMWFYVENIWLERFRFGWEFRHVYFGIKYGDIQMIVSE